LLLLLPKLVAAVTIFNINYYLVVFSFLSFGSSEVREEEGGEGRKEICIDF